MTPAVRRVRSGSPWEESIGCAQAVVAGDRVLVGGTTAFKGAVLFGEGDPYEQARVAFAGALEAIGTVGLGADSVVRTRIYLAHARDIEEVGRAHREVFDSVRPVATLVVVSGFADPRILVEVELEAVLSAAVRTGERTVEQPPPPSDPAAEQGASAEHGASRPAPGAASGGPAAGAGPSKPSAELRGEPAEPRGESAEPGGESAR
ncbi:hypothetical protein Sm713_38660 [Streptomyces sp. TS71-3]|nr:hypothetical protein Sm713_38660 [Streptomyces sp. TS71-3]